MDMWWLGDAELQRLLALASKILPLVRQKLLFCTRSCAGKYAQSTKEHIGNAKPMPAA